METLQMPGDELSPKVILNAIDSVFSIEGESRPEHPIKYFGPVFVWFNSYVASTTNSNDTKRLKIDLEYFNSTTAKILYDIFKLLKIASGKQQPLLFEVDWYYQEDDTDMLESGEEMHKLSGLKFNYLPKK